MIESLARHRVYYYSRPAAPAVSTRSNIGGGCTGNAALCWRCITFINPTLGTTRARASPRAAHSRTRECTHAHARRARAHARERNCMEPFAITYMPRVVNDSFCIRGRSEGPVATPASIFSMRVGISYRACSRAINRHRRYAMTDFIERSFARGRAGKMKETEKRARTRA